MSEKGKEALANVKAKEAKSEESVDSSSPPKFRVKFKNNIQARADALSQEAARVQRAAEASRGYEANAKPDGTPRIGVWKNPKAVKDLKLVEAAMSDRPEDELILDVIPGDPDVDGGVSTNGYQMPAGSTQLLPQHMWRDIRGRISKRQAEEKNFLHPKANIDMVVGVYRGNG